ncbi:MAG TPA: RidA family protein, partial [Thermoanaerobaculia bacterium]|nr:RidA family protein [Thermoanaerobaculia bacterium]
ALGSLDRVASWLRVFGMVNAAPGFQQLPLVINGFSELIVELYGPERGRHARSAVGLAELPLGIPVEIEAEVAIDG